MMIVYLEESMYGRIPTAWYACGTQRHPRTLAGGVIAVKSYLFRIVLTKEDDGRWSAEVPILTGCATCGDTQEEALTNIHDAVEAYIRDMHTSPCRSSRSLSSL